MVLTNMLSVGVDIGLTGMKAIAFDLDGRIKFRSKERSPQHMPKPHWVERSGSEFWDLFCKMLSDLSNQVRADGRYKIGAIGIDAHGDGVFLIDAQGNDIRPGILSLDTRGIDTAAMLNESKEADLLRVTGQNVGPASPGTVLRWLADNEPDNLNRAAHFILASDLLRLKLTDSLGTDITSASQAFTDVYTQEYSDEAFEIYGLEQLKYKKAPINNSSDVVGTVTKKASKQTGLDEGIPVIAGMHDVDAGTIGAGAVRPGQMALMAGTWSMNVVISDAPKVDPHWFARAFVEKGQWLNMSISPAGASNLEWFVNNLCKADRDILENAGINPYSFIDHEVAKTSLDDQYMTFIPYLYGNPMGIDASGTFSGIRAWHSRADMLRAIYEGLAFNHLHHSAPLIDAFEVSDVRVSGGVAMSKRWPQILANTFGMPIGLPKGGESGALGAAMVAAVAVGNFKDLAEANQAMGCDITYVEPEFAAIEPMRERYERYRDLVSTVQPWWKKNA